VLTTYNKALFQVANECLVVCDAFLYHSENLVFNHIGCILMTREAAKWEK